MMFKKIVCLAILAAAAAVLPSCLNTVNPIPTAVRLENPANIRGYMFVYFRGERRNEWEQIYFAVSEDGLKWQALNDSKSVLQSNLGERGVRDPFIVRNPLTDKIYIIATDLCIGLNGDWGRAQTSGSKAIIVWESDDMVNWSEPRRVEIAPNDAGCTWAPEAFWDEDKNEFMVFWASMTMRNGQRKQRIFCSRTKDFKEFTPAQLYIEKQNHIIDTDIVKEKGILYRFSKDESTKSILMETSDKLDGTWTQVAGFPRITGYEGPECFRLNDGTDRWCLLLDYYSKGEGYKPFFATDLASGKFTPAEASLTFPHRFRHGSVIPLSEKEYKAVIQKWGIGKQN